MNTRADPWRQRPTSEISDLMLQAVELKLYLLQELGPTLFVFKDDDGNKFRVTIGNRVSCSCNLHRHDQCVHSLYVFLKIYQFNMEDPLTWQTAYIDSEINEIIRHRFNPQGSSKPKKQLPKLKKRATSIPHSRPNVIQRIELDPEDVCSICHENMSEDQGLSWCKKKCGNNFHLKCILIWAEHKQSTDDKINCPMCRVDWGTRGLDALKEEQDEFESKLIMHKGHKCGACKSYKQQCIKGKLFHCMYCENFELCEKCYLSYEHFEHNKYLVKELCTDGWRPARSRDSVYLKRTNKYYQFVKDLSNIDKSPGIDYRIAMLNMNMANYQDFADDKKMSDNICFDNETTMEDFIISCFPDFQSDLDLYQQRPQNALTIIGRDMRKHCLVCNQEKGDRVRLKRMFCGHLIHENCLMELFGNKKMTCPEDGAELLKGFKIAFFPDMATTPPTVIELYQKNPEKMVSRAYQTKKQVGTKSVPPTRKVSKPGTAKLMPLELDITGKNVIKVPEPESVAESLSIQVMPSVEKRMMGGGLRVLRPPRNPNYLIRSRDKPKIFKPALQQMEVQGMMITTNNSEKNMTRQKNYVDEEDVKRLEQVTSKRGTMGSLKVEVGNDNNENDEPVSPGIEYVDI